MVDKLGLCTSSVHRESAVNEEEESPTRMKVKMGNQTDKMQT